MEHAGIEFRYNDKIVTTAEIRSMEAERAREALKVLKGSGMDLFFNGSTVNYQDVMQLEDSDIVRCCNETKRTLTMPVILEKMKPLLMRSDSIWREIAENGQYKTNLQSCFVDLHVAGLSLGRIRKAVPRILQSTNEDLAYTLHPEHYVFSKKGRNQFVLENLGTYVPVYSRLETSLVTRHFGYKPVCFDDGTKFAGKCEFFLISNGTKMKTFGMHQIKPSKESLDIRLGLFFPDSAPQSVIEGHKCHFCVEFYNAFMLIDMLINGKDATNEQWSYERKEEWYL